MDAATAAQLFIHLRIPMGTVVGLGMARLLLGFAGFIQHPGRAKLYPVHLMWGASLFLMLVHFWWWEFALIHKTDWSYIEFIFLIAYCTALFLLSVLLFPDDVKEYGGYEEFFIARRAWFFGLLALTIVFDVFDSSLKGPDYLANFDLEYTVQVPLGIAFCAIAILTRNRYYHYAIALAQLLYQLSWIVRLFYVHG